MKYSEAINQLICLQKALEAVVESTEDEEVKALTEKDIEALGLVIATGDILTHVIN